MRFKHVSLTFLNLPFRWLLSFSTWDLPGNLPIPRCSSTEQLRWDHVKPMPSGARSITSATTGSQKSYHTWPAEYPSVSTYIRDAFCCHSCNFRWLLTNYGMVHSPGLVICDCLVFLWDCCNDFRKHSINFTRLSLKFRCGSLACFVNKCRSYLLTLTSFSNNNIPPTSGCLYMQNLLLEFSLHFLLVTGAKKIF